jgi:hypothetical protein
MGYSRVGSQLLLRALRTWSLEGFADAGSTGLPLFGLLRNRGVGGFSLDKWVRPLPDPVGNQCRCVALPKPCAQFCWLAQ